MSAIMAHLCVCGLLLRAPKREPQQQQSLRSSTISDNRPDKTRRGSCVMFLEEVAKNFDLSLFRNVRFIFQSAVNGFLQGAIFFFLACPQTSNILQPLLDAFLGILIVDCKVVCCAHLLQDRTLE